MESSDKPKITYEDFSKLEIKIGEILSAEKVPETDKLLKLSVNFAEAVPRTIVSGIALKYPDPSLLIGRKVAFVTNLEPKILRGIESDGMILAASTETGDFSLLETSGVSAGAKVK